MSGAVKPLWRLLGEPSIAWAGRELAPRLGRKPLALIAYLAVTVDGASRDELAALLWPGPDPARSKHSLRQALVTIKRAFGDGFDNAFAVSEDHVRLERAVFDVDIVRLLEIDAGQAASAEELIDLCRGPFLRSFATRARPFDDWATAQRARFIEIMPRVLRQAVADCQRSGSSPLAAQLAARLHDLEASAAIEGPANQSPLAPVPISPSPAFADVRHHLRRFRMRPTRILLLGVLVALLAMVSAYAVSPDLRSAVQQIVFGQPATPPRIAVRPFTTLAGSPEEQSLAGGVTLGVTYALYAITARELFVVTAPPDIRELEQIERIALAEQLGVRYLISGVVGVDGDSVRVFVQCLDAETGIDVWRDSFDRPMTRAFELQDDITLRILRGLQIELSTAERNRIQFLDDTDNLHAWLAAANGVRHLIRTNRHDLEIARRSYEAALAYDANYMSARRGLAWTSLLNVRLGWAPDPPDALTEARNHMGVILRNRSDDGTTKSLEGLILLLEGQWDEAVAAGVQASELLPGSADVWAVLAHTYTFAGEPDRALEAIERAMELSPLHPGWYRWTKARALRLSGEADDAVALLERDLDLDEPVLIHLVELTAAYAAAERFDDARSAAELIRSLEPGFSASVWVEHPRSKTDEAQSLEFELLSKAGL